jgi:hypothetical protein
MYSGDSKNLPVYNSEAVEMRDGHGDLLCDGRYVEIIWTAVRLGPRQEIPADYLAL